MAKPKKAKAPAVVDRKALLEGALAKIRGKYGNNAVIAGSAVPPMRRLPTGIPMLDVALGVSGEDGGFPVGRITLIPGHESACKSTTCFMAIAQAQLWGWPCVLIETEKGFDGKWAQTMGVDLDKLIIEPSSSMERSLDIAAELIRSMPEGLIVLDSLASMSPSGEIDSSFYEWQQGLSARINNKFFRVSAAGANYASNLDAEYNGPTVLVTQQYRTSIKTGSKKILPGGEGQKFAGSVIMGLKSLGPVWHIPGKGPQTTYPKSPPKGTLVVGNVFGFAVTKNKTAPPHRAGEFTLYTMNHHDPDTGHTYVAGTVDYYEQVAALARLNGVIEMRGSWGYLEGEQLANGLDAIAEKLRDTDVLERVLAGVMAAEEQRGGKAKET